MKKSFVAILSVLLCTTFFASFSPSLDGRAVVAEQGAMPKGLFAKTVGYLPGDSISVTSLSTKKAVDILVVGSIDSSEGIAILLSPEAAEVLGLSKDSNNVVKITKRSGQLDEAVSGTAVIGGKIEAEEDNVSEETEEVEESDEVEEVEEVAAADDSSEVEKEAETETPLDAAESVAEPATEPATELSEETEEKVEVIDDSDLTPPLQEEDKAEATVTEVPKEEEISEIVPQENVETLGTAEEEIKDDSELQETEVKSEPEVEVEEVLEENVISEPLAETENTEAENEAATEEEVKDFEVIQDDENVSDIPEETEAKTLEENTDIVEESVASDELEDYTEEEKEPSEVESEPEKIEATEAPEIPETVVQEEPKDELESESFEEDALIPLSEPEKNMVNQEDEELSEVPGENEKTDEDVVSVVPFEEEVYSDDLSALPEEEKKEETLESETTDENVSSGEEESYEPIILVPASENPPIENKVTEVPSESVQEKNVVPEETKKVEVKNTTKKKSLVEKYKVQSLSDLKKGKYYVQIAVLSNKENLETTVKTFEKQYPITLVPLKDNKGYQVLIGPLNMDEYGTVLNRFKKSGYKDAFLRKIK